MTVFRNGNCKWTSDTFCVKNDDFESYRYDVSSIKEWLGKKQASSFSLPANTLATFYKAKGFADQF